MDGIALDISAQSRHVDRITIDKDGKLAFPQVAEVPGSYQFTVKHPSGGTSLCVGETDRLRRRFQHYRTPGPTQHTNIRLNELFRSIIQSGGSVHVSVIESATASDTPLDLARKADRLLVESAWLVLLRRAGHELENR